VTKADITITVTVAGEHLPDGDVDWTSAGGIRCFVSGRSATITWATNVADYDRSANEKMLEMVEVLDGLLAAISLQIGSPVSVKENTVAANFVLEGGREWHHSGSQMAGRHYWPPLQGSLYGPLADGLQDEHLREVAYLLRDADRAFRAGGLTGCAALVEIAIEGLIALEGIPDENSAASWRVFAQKIGYDEDHLLQLYWSIQLARHWSATRSAGKLKELKLRPLLENDWLGEARKVVACWLAAKNPTMASTFGQIFGDDPTKVDILEGFGQRHPLGIRREVDKLGRWWS
jgi:hypothetical protein